MRAVVTSVERYDYAKVLRVGMKAGEAELKLELPLKVLEEVGWRPSEGDEVEVELAGEKGDLEEWDIVLSGRLLSAEGRLITYSFGGLLCTIEGARLETPERVYLRLKVRPRGR
ncbi:MAG: hypothetical protein DRK00_05470 [Thermoprotei archaeon]|nr:MAG: hypothetical protein DRK00_05470 [Thermoprotei archaeon]